MSSVALSKARQFYASCKIIFCSKRLLARGLSALYDTSAEHEAEPQAVERLKCFSKNNFLTAFL